MKSIHHYSNYIVCKISYMCGLCIIASLITLPLVLKNNVLYDYYNLRISLVVIPYKTS